MTDDNIPAESPPGEMDDSDHVDDALDAGLAAGFGTEGSVSIGTDRGSVLKLLGKSVHRIPRVLLKSPASEGEDPVVRAASSEVPTTSPDSRYRLDGEIARGGMGVIIKGRDTDLGRDLAIKVMLDSQKNRPNVVERFIEEAQIGGQLQHPGIAPVYELGQFQDNRPFFTMKLVKGETLSALLAERDTPSKDRARYVGIFEQICQTVAYAHSRGVVHRDLKPANIMVGAFGEVQVMDWGLAKVLGTGDIESCETTYDTQQQRSIVKTIRSHGSDTPNLIDTHTQTGSVLGTPAYMAPEQAAGEVDSLDERADVFGLGAILCEILTGRPPYVGDDKSEVLELAKGGRLGDCFERLSDCECDQELIAIVRDCLTVESGDRFRDAGIVSERITNHLESVEQRLRQVELDRIEANVRAEEERKRRKVMLALAAQEERLARQISDELSTARALRGEVESGRLPDPETLSRALEATRRAQSLLSPGEVDEDLSAQVTQLLTTLESQNRDQNLQAALEKTWEWELDRLAEQDEFERHKIALSGHPPSNPGDAGQREGRVPGVQVQLPAVAGAATLYEQAFASWGLKPDQTSLADAARRIQALHSAYQASVLVSLDRWRELLGAPRSLQDWGKVEWSILKSVKLTARGGDLLQVQPDGSILASGKHPERGCDLVLETDERDVLALRLEALLDDSLPNRGPGRGRGGVFAIDGLRVWCAPKANPDRKRRLKFRSAVADHTHPSAFPYGPYPTFPLTTESWHIREGGGKAHTAVFEVEEPVQSDSGFQLTISHEDRDADRWGCQNLGRFRWSVSADRRDRPVAQWLADLVDQADRDDWRRSMRSEIRRGDIDSLIQRASDPQAIEDQPEIILVQLAKVLRETGDVVLFGMLPDTISWEVLKPIVLESEGGATLELQDDGSIFSSGRNPFRDTLVITAPVGDRPVTAIRLETITDRRLPSGGAGRSYGGQLALVGFEADVHRESNPENNEPLVVDRAIADFARSPAFSLSKAVDGVPTTAWHIPPGHRQSHTAIFVTRPVKGDGEKYVRIRLEAGNYFCAPGRFRLAVTRDPILLPDPKHAALELLQRIHRRHPDNFWVNLALAQTLSQVIPPAFDEALRYATAALALCPENAMSHATLLRVLPTNQLASEHRLRELACFHASRVRELDADNASIQYIATQQVEHGFLRYMQGKLDEAIAKHSLAIDLQPDSAKAHHWLGLALAADGRLEDAIAAYRQSLEIDHEYVWPYVDIGFALFDQGKFEEASVTARKALEIYPESPEAHRVLGVVLNVQGRLNDATDAYRRALDLMRHQGKWDQMVGVAFRQVEGRPPMSSAHFGPTDPAAHFEYGILMLEEGKLDEAIPRFHKALELDPEHGMALYHLGNALRQQGKLDEAIQAYRRAVRIDPNYAHAHHDLGIALTSQGKLHQAREAFRRAAETGHAPQEDVQK